MSLSVWGSASQALKDPFIRCWGSFLGGHILRLVCRGAVVCQHASIWPPENETHINPHFRCHSHQAPVLSAFLCILRFNQTDKQVENIHLNTHRSWGMRWKTNLTTLTQWGCSAFMPHCTFSPLFVRFWIAAVPSRRNTRHSNSGLNVRMG